MNTVHARRRPWLIVVACAFLMLFAAAAGAQEKTTVTIWWQNNGADAEQAQIMVDEFNRTHPWVHVDLVVEVNLSGGAGLDKVKTAIAAGTPPDIIYQGMHIQPELFLDGLIIPIDEVLPADFLNSIEYLPAARQLTSLSGRTLAVQFRTDARGLYYNIDMFDEAGLDSTTGPSSISDLDAYAELLTRWSNDGSVQRLGFAPRGNNFLNELGWLWVFGGSPYDFERNELTIAGNPAHLRVLEWIAGYAQRYGALATSSAAFFQNQTVAMHLNSTTQLGIFPVNAPELRWGVSHIPYPPEGIRTTNSSGPGPVIPYGAANVEAAAEFIKYMASKDVQKEWYRLTQQPPARADALFELISAGEITDPREIVMLELMPNGIGVPPAFSGVVQGLWTANADRVRREEITPQQALDNVQREAEPAYNQLFRR